MTYGAGAAGHINKILKEIGVDASRQHKLMRPPDKSARDSWDCHHCGKSPAEHCSNCPVPCCPGRCR